MAVTELRAGSSTAAGVPPGSLDGVLMVNSVVFKDAWVGGGDDVAYLRDFLEHLKPGGWLLYHRDWLDPTHLGRGDVTALFTEAGFEPDGALPMPAHIPATTWYLAEGPSGPRSDVRRGYLLRFRRPGP